jgi:N-ethylmaleimide reductase
MQDLPTPESMTIAEVKSTIGEYVTAAKNAVSAGFDGVELHSANGYLIEQFINPGTNLRSDEYGGNIANRGRFLLEMATEIVAAIGKDKVGVRFSPYGPFNDMPPYPNEEKLSDLGILYLHVLDHSSMGAPPVPQRIKDIIRATFKHIMIVCGGFDKDKGEAVLQIGNADLVAYGKPFLANPDLVKRMQTNAPMNQLNMDTLYAPGEKGYTDYPFLGA